MRKHKRARQIQAAIEIEGGEQGFDRVGEQGGLAAASGFFLSPAKPEVAPQMQLVGAVQEMIGIDEMGAKLGKLTLLIGREALKKLLAGDQLQDGVAEEFELLIVSGRAEALACEGAVGQRLLQQCAICELVAERGFEIVERKMLHRKTCENRLPHLLTSAEAPESLTMGLGGRKLFSKCACSCSAN